jgi:hypothetical protein
VGSESVTSRVLIVFVHGLGRLAEESLGVPKLECTGARQEGSSH